MWVLNIKMNVSINSFSNIFVIIREYPGNSKMLSSYNERAKARLEF